MKALPMLDHVAVWIARSFVLTVFANFLFVIANFIILTHSADPNPLTIPFFVLCLLSSLSLWFPDRIMSRLFLGLTSSFLILLIASSKVIYPGNNPLIWLDGLSLIGFGAMFWVATRPPRQTESPPSPSPVNLVNPV